MLLTILLDFAQSLLFVLLQQTAHWRLPKGMRSMPVRAVGTLKYHRNMRRIGGRPVAVSKIS